MRLASRPQYNELLSLAPAFLIYIAWSGIAGLLMSLYSNNFYAACLVASCHCPLALLRSVAPGIAIAKLVHFHPRVKTLPKHFPCFLVIIHLSCCMSIESTIVKICIYILILDVQTSFIPSSLIKIFKNFLSSPLIRAKFPSKAYVKDCWAESTARTRYS